MKKHVRKLRRRIAWGFLKTGIHLLFNYPLKILMYHRFMDDGGRDYALSKSVFEIQVRFLKKYFTLMSLSDYLTLRASKGKVRNPMVLTIDDGYRNFYRYAFPVLRKHSLPATLFVPCNFIEHGDWMWQDRNKYILRNSTLKSFDLEWRGKSVSLSIDGFDNLLKALEIVYELSAPLSLADKKVFSDQLARLHDVTIPERPVPGFAPLSWEEIGEMMASGIEMGSHTMNHQILTLIAEDEAFREIEESRMMLECRLGREVVSFCYPNGNHNGRLVDHVRDCGYGAAVTTESGVNRRTDSVFTLKRIGAPVGEDMNRFSRRVFLSPLSPSGPST